MFDGGRTMLRLVDGFAPLGERVRRLFPIAVTLVFVLLVIAGLASTYFGHARSPYNSCYASNGRAISCAVLEALR
jgi:hypothetical protein